MKRNIFKMKRKNLIIVIVCLCAVILAGEVLLLLHVFGKGDRERSASESGEKEKQPSEKLYVVLREKEIKIDYTTYTFTRDDNGNVIRLEIHEDEHYVHYLPGPGGHTVPETVIYKDYSYDEEGNFLNVTTRNKNEGEEIDEHIALEITSSGISVENGVVFRKPILGGYNYGIRLYPREEDLDCERDRDGRVVKATHCYEDGTIAAVCTFQYTKFGRIGYAEADWQNGKKLQVYFEHDSFGMPVRMSSYYENKQLKGEIRWKYEEISGEERLTEIFRNNENEPYAKIKYEPVVVPERCLTENEKEELGLPFDETLIVDPDVIYDPENWWPGDERYIVY